MSKRNTPGFRNNPFEGLKKLHHQQKKEQKKIVSKPPPPEKERLAPKTEEEVFAEAMGSVTAMNNDKYVEQNPGSLPEFSWEESMADFEQLFSENDYFNVFIGEEHIEGHVHDLDKKLFTRLRRGHYSLQAHLDLHGMTVDEAKDSLRLFVDQQQSLGHRCVLVIHGRGLHSPDKIPVLKQKLANWMSRGFLRKRVLGFVSAKPQDGGTGAVYVLLRKKH